MISNMIGAFVILQISMATAFSTGCDSPLGMESGAIKDFQISASHWLYKSAHYEPVHARLNKNSLSGAWCSEGVEEHTDQYIQIDLLKNTKITAIATQGRSKLVEYIEKFQLLYQREEEEKFRMYNESGVWKEFQANKDSTSIAKNIFNQPIIARKIRLYPRGEEFAIYCARLELYGCKWSHRQSTLKSYTSPLGSVKNGVNMKDVSYDGVLKSNSLLYDGLGKLTDDMYGSKVDNKLTNSQSPWVAYNKDKPTISFHLKEKKVIKQIMIHVNNNNNDIEVFRKVDILVSDDDITYTSVKKYETNEEQRKKIDAYPVVCNLGEVVGKHVKLEFINDKNKWLLISEIVIMTDTYPPKSSILPERTTDNNVNTRQKEYTPKPNFTLQPNGYDGRNKKEEDEEEKDKTTKDKDTKGLSFPIILTIALVTLVLGVVVGVIIYKSYKKNQRHDDTPLRTPSQHQQQQIQINNQQKQDNLALLGEERYMPAFHHQPQMKQQNVLLPQGGTGMYFQPTVHQTGYNTKVMMP